MDLTERALLSRIDNVLSEVADQLADINPQATTSVALTEIQAELLKQQSLILESPKASDVYGGILLTASLIVKARAEALGILRRSSHSRNAFEFHRPISDIARRLMGRDGGVVLSSEWNYSPFVRHTTLGLNRSGLVLMGLPATESGNPLVIPLAGHEIGHAIWKQHARENKRWEDYQRAVSRNKDKRNPQHDLKCKENKEKNFCPALISLIAEDVKNGRWNREPLTPQQFSIVTRYIEEVFSDFVATYVFGVSYPLAFHYLLAPNIYQSAPIGYPNLARRYCWLIEAEESFRILTGEPCRVDDRVRDLKASFHDSDENSDEITKSIETSIEKNITTIARHVVDRCSNLPRPGNGAFIDELLEYFSVLCPVPAEKAACGSSDGNALANLILAGWVMQQNNNPFKDPSIPLNRKDVVIRDLVLKSIELVEIHALEIEAKSKIKVEGSAGDC